MNLLFDTEAFYKSLKELPDVNSDLDNKRAEIKKIVFSFNDSLQKLTVDNKLVKRNKDLGKLLIDTIEQIKASGQSWIKNYQQIEEREKFRCELSNYFIVIIFGKVKAGKSSLGNFIAKQKLPNQEVNFFKYDKAGKEVSVKELEEIGQDGFATDNLECTAEIQGFKLDGLAWIDTPGLGSMTKENGDLAKEYIQSADYIIYPTSSDSPLQKDETEQLIELFAQNKKVTICITKSDNTEEDECICGSEDGCGKCEGGLTKVLINKQACARQDQEDWVRDEVKKIIPKDKKESLLGDVFSLSVHTAKQGLAENNPELYEKSHLPVFYKQVTDVLSNKASELKTSAPYDGIKTFINKDILGRNCDANSIEMIKYSLSDLDRQINQSLERFEELKKNTQHDVQTIVDDVLTKYSSKIDKTNFNGKTAQIDNEIGTLIQEELHKNVVEMFSDFEASLDQFTSSLGSRKFEIKDKYKEVSYSTKERNKKIASGICATIATIAAVSLATATGGVSLAVGAAAAAAGLTGGYIGGKAGEATGSNQITTVHVGDNKEEVLQQFRESRQCAYVEYVNMTYQNLQDDFFTPLKEVSKNIATEIQDFENRLTNFRDRLC